jgi:hypothetical protein
MIQGPLPLILLAAREHPDADFRQKLWSILEAWLDTKSPRFDEVKAMSLVAKQKGTYIEPFTVSGADQKLAAFLLRLALSEDIDASRFRIVGEETIGNDGGAVFTRNGKSFYSERYAYGKNKLHNSYVQFFAPGMKVEPPARTAKGKFPPARMEAAEDGVFIFLDSPSFDNLDWISEPVEQEFKALAKGLTSDSVLGEKHIPLGELGLSIQAGDKGIIIGSRSPESLIRLSAYIVQGSRITLKGVGNYELVIQIPKTGDGEADSLIVAQDQFALEWMDVTRFGAPAIDDEDIIKISEWALPHAEWTERVIEGAHDTVSD